MSKWTKAEVFSMVGGALASAIAAEDVLLPSAYAQEKIVIPDGPNEGTTWSPDLTPQLVEPLNMMSPDNPVNMVAIRKSAQVGATQIGINWMGYIIAQAPCPAMVVMPTLDGASVFNSEKLTPTILRSPDLNRRVVDVSSRSSRSSTKRFKRFAGGAIGLTGANSAAGLRSRTVQCIYSDDIDEWPRDLAGQGDPMVMVAARYTSYLAAGTWKHLQTSTPTIKGNSPIDDLFEKGDQRYWHVVCPHCDAEQYLVFGGKNETYGLKFNRTYPYNAYYACRANGCVIEHHQKEKLVRAGRWIATQPGPGRYPSYHLDTISSLLVPWDEIAQAFLASKDDPASLKAFWNLKLGLPWVEKGDAPDWQRLFARRQDRPRGVVPAGGLILTAAVDVQQDGLYYEVVAWGEGRTSWVVDCDFISGQTELASGTAWQKLAEIYDRSWPCEGGARLSIDMMGIDSGYNSTAVYAFVRGRNKCRALKGQPGWLTPPITTPSDKDITFAGKKKRRGLKVWGVGTWSLKSEMYGFIRKDGVAEGEDHNPPGYTHFATFQDQGYFQQLTAEHVKMRTIKGREAPEWVATGPNHYHDCRVYNLALTYALKLDQFTPANWAVLRQRRAVLPDQPDLLDQMTGPAAEVAAAKVDAAPETETAEQQQPETAPAARKARRKSRRPTGGVRRHRG